MKSRKEQHQGNLKMPDHMLIKRMRVQPEKWFTTLDICKIAQCVSARDKIRKLQANGIPIGPAKMLYVTDSGARVFGWRIKK